MTGMQDAESHQTAPRRIPLFRQLFDKAGITPEVESWHYNGSGTEEDPYVVTWIDNDPRNPMLYSETTKWGIALLVGIATLAVAFVSSAYTGGADSMIKEFHCSELEFSAGLSVFVLGFAIGPLLWAPMSEIFGRQILFFGTYLALMVFEAASAGANDMGTVLGLRFLAGAFGSSPLTNAGGVLADMFNAKQRGLALCVWAAAPSAGPIIGPIVGGFVGETVGWRWIMGIEAIFTAVLWIACNLLVPETYAPVLLRARAAALSKKTGKVYRTRGDIDQGPKSFVRVFRTALLRPWILLIKEPIVLLLTIYMSIVYGTLYMFFTAFPIVFQEGRGWSPGIGGLSFLGVLVGMIIAVVYNLWDNKRYGRISDEHDGFAPPEARLPAVMVGAVAIPIGLFWFAWTNGPSVHWIVPVLAGLPFGFAMILVFLGQTNYLVDSYTIYAASVLAANTVLRSVFAAAFPLFTPYMYRNLGIHWASSIPAFLSVACLPFPFIFYKYGAAIRKRCKYAAEAAAFMERLQAQMKQRQEKSSAPTSTSASSAHAESVHPREDDGASGELKANEHHNTTESSVAEVEDPEKEPAAEILSFTHEVEEDARHETLL